MADAWAVVGEKYSLPLLREMSYGVHRFSDLAALTGAPRALLTKRLRKLEDAGAIVRRRYSDHPPRDEYHLTEAGAELVPVILMLKAWGERHAADAGPDAGPYVVFAHDCGARLDPVVACAACRRDVDPATLVVVGGSAPPSPLG